MSVVFAKPTKVACAKEKALAWKSNAMERKKCCQAGKVQCLEVDGLKRQQQQSFLPLLLTMWVNICITEDLPLFTLALLCSERW